MVRPPGRPLVLLLAGLVLVGAAWWLRSSPWLREALLRGKDAPALEAASRRRPDDALTHYYLAKRYYLDHRFAEAQAAFEATARLDPDSPRVHLGLGLSYYETGQVRRAQEEFERTLQDDSRSAWAEYMLGKILWQQGDTRGALPHVQRATEIDPRSDQAWYGLGICDLQAGHYAEGIAALRKAVERRPADPKYETALGEALISRGQTDEGRRHYERALQINPRYGPACALLGEFLFRRAPGPEAIVRAEELLTRATTLDTPRPMDVWFDLGQLYIQEGRYPQAVAALRTSLEKDPRDERPYYGLAGAYRRMGDAKMAAAAEARFDHISTLHVRMQEREVWASRHPGSAAAHLSLARVYRDLGLTEKAVPQYLAAFSLAPPSPELVKEWKQLLQKQAQAPANKPARDFVLPPSR